VDEAVVGVIDKMILKKKRPRWDAKKKSLDVLIGEW
jgi:hypothetical protein